VSEKDETCSLRLCGVRCSCGGQQGGHPTIAQREAELKERLLNFLDRIDAETRLPGEPSLREAVADQARGLLEEMRRPAP